MCFAGSSKGRGGKAPSSWSAGSRAGGGLCSAQVWGLRCPSQSWGRGLGSGAETLVTAFETRASQGPRGVFQATSCPGPGDRALVKCEAFLFVSFCGSGSVFRAHKWLVEKWGTADTAEPRDLGTRAGRHVGAHPSSVPRSRAPVCVTPAALSDIPAFPTSCGIRPVFTMPGPGTIQ